MSSPSTTAAPVLTTGPAFGGQAVDEALVLDHDGERWSREKRVPFADLAVGGSTRALHYGQSVFEGLKAVRSEDGAVRPFRVRDHCRRLVRSAERMALPPPDPEALAAAIEAFVHEHADHTPDAPGSLYVRPLLYASTEDLYPGAGGSARLQVTLHPVEPFLGARPGARLTTAPGARAFPGGTGAVKCAGNYAAVMRARREAQAAGFDEILWLDARERRYVEETSSANVFVVREGELWTPPAGDTVLEGITRRTVLELAEAEGIPTRVEPVPIDAVWWRGVDEAFCTGTAVGLAPILGLVHDDRGLFEGQASGPIGESLGHAYRQALHSGMQ